MAADKTPQRVLLDLQFTPDDESLFIPDAVMEALDGIGEIGEVRMLWAGGLDEPIGNIPWPRIAPAAEQEQTDAALAQIAADEAEDAPEPEPTPADGPHDEVTVGVPGETRAPTEAEVQADPSLADAEIHDEPAGDGDSDARFQALAGEAEEPLEETNEGYSPKADPAPVDDPAPEASAPKASKRGKK